MIPASAPSKASVAVMTNERVCQNGGSTMTAMVAPVSFQMPSSLQAVTRNTYLPGVNRVKCATRSPPASVGFLSRPSSWYLNRTASCARFGAEKFRLVKWISNCSFCGVNVTLSGQVELNGLFFCGTPSTSTDSMTTGGGLLFGFKSAGLTETNPSVVGNQSLPSCARIAAGCTPAEH